METGLTRRRLLAITAMRTWYSMLTIDYPWYLSKKFRRWCHGAPAVVILLSAIIRKEEIYKQISSALQDRIASALEKGTAFIYDQGFLRKGVGLCHGVGGSVFALLSAADAFSALARSADSDETRQASLCLRRATHFALLATEWRRLTEQCVMDQPDRPWSLYEGLAGMCTAWAAVAGTLNGGKMKGMPGYSDLEKII
jgi:hypothetical protein